MAGTGQPVLAVVSKSKLDFTTLLCYDHSMIAADHRSMRVPLWTVGSMALVQSERKEIAPMSSTLIEKYEFESPINLEGSWGCRPVAKRTKSVMEFYLNTDDTGYIEWDVPDLDLFESIGLTFEIDPAGKRRLVDYDGVMSFPKQARALLERHGIDTTEITG